MATFTATVLAEGQIPNVQGAIYSATAVTFVKALTVKNTNAAAQTVQFWINVSGVARAWKQVVLALNEFAEMLTDAETLELPIGATIEAVTTTAAAVDFVVSGVRQT
jgi:hypothetical protein